MFSSYVITENVTKTACKKSSEKKEKRYSLYKAKVGSERVVYSCGGFPKALRYSEERSAIEVPGYSLITC